MKLDLKTKRLHLRIFTVKDITSQYVKALNTKDIIGLTESRYRTWDLNEVRRYIQEKAYNPGQSVLIGIFLLEGERHIGNIRLHTFSNHNSRVEVGVLIWDKNEWGKNYGTEAMEAVINYIFEKLKLHQVCAEYYSINRGSAKMFKKLGFKKEGILKDYFLVDNKYVDAVRIAKFNPNNYAK